MATDAYKIRDFSAWMDTVNSEYMIALNSSVLLRNMTTEGNRIVTLSWFTKYYETDSVWRVQGWATDGKTQAWIQWNDLYFYDDDTKEQWVFTWAVGVGVNGGTSTDEDYNILIYKDCVIVTNSLKSGVSPLNCEGERPRAFQINNSDKCFSDCKQVTDVEITQKELECLDWDYAPTTSIVHNGILYFGGGPRGSEYRNRINWWGIEQFEVVNPLDNSIIQRNYLLNFCRELPNYDDASEVWNFISNYQFIGDGEPITAFFANGDSLYVGKRNSIHRATQNFTVWNIPGVIDSNFSNIEISLNHTVTQSTGTGIKNQEVVHNVHGNTIYYDGTHVRRLEYDTSNQTLKDVTLSYKLREYLKCLPNDQRYATSLYTYPFLKFFLRDDISQTGDNIAIVYNIETEAWSIQDNIYISHAWSGYDERSDSWQGFWGSEFSNLLFRDNVGTTWWDEPREFEWIGPMFNFGDCNSYKNLRELNICTSVWDDTEVEFSIDTLSTKDNNVCKSIGKTYPLRGSNSALQPTTATGTYWVSQFGSSKSIREKVVKTWMTNTSIKTNILHRQWYQPHIIGSWYWEFEIEYMDLYIEPTLIRNYSV